MSHTGRGVRGCGLLLAVTALGLLGGCPVAGDAAVGANLSALQTFVEEFLRQVVAGWLT